MNSNLYVLISTIDERILNLKDILQLYDEKIHYIISHQQTKQLDQKILAFIDDLTKRKDVVYRSMEGKGVARNRNNTLQFIAPSAICLILDDDVVLCEDAFETVLKSFDENPSAEFMSFKILDLGGNDYKVYPKEKQWHTLRTLTGIGTTEMAFKSDLILDHHIRFDERFGPGAEKYPLGEDFIFAMDLYHLKSKMLFVPIPIVKHPAESTGMRLESKIIFARGAMFARVFGWKAFVVNILFSMKKYLTYRHKMSFFTYCLLLTEGAVNYFKSSVKGVS